MPKGQQWKKEQCKSSSRGSSGESAVLAAVKRLAIKDKPIQKPVTIHEAASNGDKDGIKKLLIQGVNIDTCDSHHRNTALHCAIEHNSEEVVKMLLEEGANVSVRGYGKNTPLHTASNLGRVNFLKYLIEARAKVNEVNMKGKTPLILACMKGHSECAEVLLKCGADLSTVDSSGRTALMYAVEQRAVNLPDTWGHPTPYSGLEMKYLRIAYKLTEMGANVNSVDLKKQTALHFAAAKGNVKMIKLMRLLGKADFSLHDKKNRTPLDVAGLNGHEAAVNEMLEFLPERLVPHSSLEIAAENGNIKFIEMLFGAFGRKAFISDVVYKATSRGHLECVQFLIKSGFGVNNRDSVMCPSRCPLQVAAEFGYVEILRELLKAGAIVDKMYDGCDKTALHFAAQNGHKQCVEELLKFGAKHLLWRDKYPWEIAKNKEIEQLLQEHQNQHQ